MSNNTIQSRVEAYGRELRVGDVITTCWGGRASEPVLMMVVGFTVKLVTVRRIDSKVSTQKKLYGSDERVLDSTSSINKKAVEMVLIHRPNDLLPPPMVACSDAPDGFATVDEVIAKLR